MIGSWAMKFDLVKALKDNYVPSLTFIFFLVDASSEWEIIFLFSNSSILLLFLFLFGIFLFLDYIEELLRAIIGIGMSVLDINILFNNTFELWWPKHYIKIFCNLFLAVAFGI